MLYIVLSIDRLAIIVNPLGLSILVIPIRSPNFRDLAILVGMDLRAKGRGKGPVNLAWLLFQIAIATRSILISLIWLGFEVSRADAGEWAAGGFF